MRLRRIALGLALGLHALAGAAPARAQELPRFELRSGGAEQGWRPIVETDGLLMDPALRNALSSGLPLRFRLRVELWRKAFFDRLVDAREVNVALLHDPLDDSFILETGAGERRYRSLTQAHRAIEAAFRVTLSPSGRGRFYYLGTLRVETLSLSDLEELRRWLRGEVQPAVAGEGSPGRAVESGLRRVLVRVIGLPTRSYEDRSATFTLR